MNITDPKWKIVPILAGTIGLLVAIFLGQWIGEGKAAPIIIFMLLLGALLVFANSSALAPFIYSLF